MSSLTSKDRASLCRFTFSDGRQCRSPRSGNRWHLYLQTARTMALLPSASRDANHLESIRTKSSPTVDSTRLTETLNPLDATLTKVLGEGVVMTQQWHRLQSVRSPLSHGQSVSMSA